METEFAIRSKRNSAVEASVYLDFERLVTTLGYEIPIARSFHNPYRIFLANGGSVSLESGASPTLQHALLEIATPECKSPKELLCYQTAMEQLLSETVRSTFAEQDAQLLKGTSDAHHHTYGQHESYDVRIASGIALAGWRIGLLLLLPVLILYKLLSAGWFVWVQMLSRLPYRWHQLRFLLSKLMGQKPKELAPKKEFYEDLGPSWTLICAAGLRCLHAPVAWLLWCNIQCFALLPHRRHMSAFLASRCILDGAGFLDQDNRFWVSLRAALVNCTIGYGSYGSSRPLFRCDSWLRKLCLGRPWSIRGYWELFRSRQRIEIAIGDSGLCQQSQYIRFGATSLVLDLVEKSPPKTLRLGKPIEATRRFAKDWMLLTSVSDRARCQWTALDIQHAYAASVRQLLQSTQSVPVEAWRILDHWQTTLNQLRPTDDEGNLPRGVLGRVDWLSKLWLLHQLKRDVSWQARKKVDLRYHELSDEGYHHKLHEMLGLAPLLDNQELAKASRVPPANSPAMTRGYLIREFSDPESNLRVDWTHAEFLVEGKKRCVEF